MKKSRSAQQFPLNTSGTSPQPAPPNTDPVQKDSPPPEIPVKRAARRPDPVMRHLHDLMNVLWPAAARIELTISDESSPPQVRELLLELGQSIEEAMSIAAQAAALLGEASKALDPQ